jgi:thiamine pyrophosphate-dependent acetolactate synthase large subunit-like protein
MAAKLAFPERGRVAVRGDGSYAMTMSALSTRRSAASPW